MQKSAAPLYSQTVSSHATTSPRKTPISSQTVSQHIKTPAEEGAVSTIQSPKSLRSTITSPRRRESTSQTADDRERGGFTAPTATINSNDVYEVYTLM